MITFVNHTQLDPDTLLRVKEGYLRFIKGYINPEDIENVEIELIEYKGKTFAQFTTHAKLIEKKFEYRDYFNLDGTYAE